jgi:hypothetical protein
MRIDKAHFSPLNLPMTLSIDVAVIWLSAILRLSELHFPYNIGECLEKG